LVGALPAELTTERRGTLYVTKQTFLKKLTLDCSILLLKTVCNIVGKGRALAVGVV
jgi:hypothetical protein